MRGSTTEGGDIQRPISRSPTLGRNFPIGLGYSKPLTPTATADTDNRAAVGSVL
ncbi:hypothetical protein [Arthrobacter sp. ISL-30]|uniref:hypothetical protein n=1 Tax=Arthrobacter sp. ISL-30 TaxID=2819109 RepID=UPI001BEC9521|nr:hypothetical protein [Arthrobacter sp. ISL-30]MBT2514573.1 hypothetical protein [Arthrobacter sp. ISL-30]